jgi:hypothetical protein
MRPDGIVLYHQSGDNDAIDCDLFGGFMSAIDSIASKLDTTGLRNISFGSKQITILKRDDLIFMALHSAREKPKEIGQGLDRMAEYFCKLYPVQVIAEWRGNLHEFDGFRGWSQ